MKKQILPLLENDQLTEAITLLLEQLPAGETDHKRVANLEKRLRELESRINQGTLNKEEIRRLRDRISGGLKDVVFNPTPIVERTEEKEKSTFVLPGKTPEEPVSAVQKPPKMGFFGEVDYGGSPSKKEETILLSKSYGAAYHAAVQAVRHCGMTMESGDRDGGKIHASTLGNTAARFGEVIYLWLLPEERGRTRVHVVVDSANPDTVFDLGRHKQKLQALLHQLRNA